MSHSRGRGGRAQGSGARPVVAINAENYDDFYGVPCGLPGDKTVLVYDAKNGIGATPNNSNVRYLGLVVEMSPWVYLKLALTIEPQDVRARTLKHYAETEDHPKPGVQVYGAFGPPTLYVDLENKLVTGHEGRHRMIFAERVSLGACKYGRIPTAIILDKGLRARDVRESELESLRAGLYEQEWGRLSENARKSEMMKRMSFVKGPLFDTAFVNGKKYTWERP